MVLNFWGENMVTILVFIFCISFIIFIHELGHLLWAKFFGVFVHEFAIGFGPKLISKKFGETYYSLRVIPLGGFVSMAGETYEQTNNLEIADDKLFVNKKWWQKIIILLGGIINNILCFFIIFTIMTFNNGVLDHLKIDEVVPNSQAAVMGLKANDELLNVKDVSVLKQDFSLEVLRSDKIINIKVDYNGNKTLGIKLSGVDKKVDFLTAIVETAKLAITTIGATMVAIAQLFVGKGYENVSGIVGVYDMTSKIAQFGIVSIINWIGILSISIGAFNLFPIPMCDGGRIVMVIIEKIIKKPIPAKVESFLLTGSAILLLLLTIFITYVDITKLFH